MHASSNWAEILETIIIEGKEATIVSENSPRGPLIRETEIEGYNALGQKACFLGS